MRRSVLAVLLLLLLVPAVAVAAFAVSRQDNPCRPPYVDPPEPWERCYEDYQRYINQ
jgi:hypothetical protein